MSFLFKSLHAGRISKPILFDVSKLGTVNPSQSCFLPYSNSVRVTEGGNLLFAQVQEQPECKVLKEVLGFFVHDLKYACHHPKLITLNYKYTL